MQGFGSELGDVEVTADEVRLILRRLAREDFGGTDNARIGDLAEVTETSPEGIARILAEIRGTPWNEWRASVDSELSDKTRKLEDLERKIEGMPNVERSGYRSATPSEQKLISRILITILVIVYGGMIVSFLMGGATCSSQPPIGP